MGLVATKPVFGVPKQLDSNQSPQLQGLARNLNFPCSTFGYDTFQIAKHKGADRSDGYAGWYESLLFANHQRQVFSRRGPNGTE